MSVKINSLELENVKRVRAVSLEPTENGLTIIGGKNKQGKTSILDSIAWALGGNKFKPKAAQHEGAETPPELKIELSNGLIVERKGKNSALTVTDSRGLKGGQQLLDSFVETFALDLPKFMAMNNSEKAQTLLKIVGVADELDGLIRFEKSVYFERQEKGRVADSKAKYAEELPYYPDAPEEIVSAANLVIELQRMQEANREREEVKAKVASYYQQTADIDAEIESYELKIEQLKADRNIKASQGKELQSKLKEMEAFDTSNIERQIQEVEPQNEKVRANQAKAIAEAEAQELKRIYDGLTEVIEVTRKKKLALLNDAVMPLPGLSVIDGELTYEGFTWEDMANSDQLKVALAIVKQLNPDCGFVLIDKLEALDMETLSAFGDWLEKEGMQAIATRVSTGEECQIVIEDGMVKVD